jgi:hypothetical protein
MAVPPRNSAVLDSQERSFFAMLLGKISLSEIWLTITGHPLPCFSKVLILKIDKVLCFDTLLEVFILKGLR